MSWQEPFKERQRAQEQLFIQQREAAERDKAQQSREREVAIHELALVTGLADEALLGELVEHGIRAETAAGFDLLPAVLIAWADGPPTPVQREQILTAARTRGIDPGAGASLLDECLDARPAQRLGDLWLEYTTARCRRLSDSERAMMRYALLHDAGKLARSARGIMGMRVRMSRSAAATLAELEGPFADSH